MNAQLDLLDVSTFQRIAQPQARARHTDPRPSHTAAHQVETVGTAKVQRGYVLGLVRRRPGLTSLEYGQLEPDCDRYVCARRLPELLSLGLVRKGPERTDVATGRPSTTWWPV